MSVLKESFDMIGHDFLYHIDLDTSVHKVIQKNIKPMKTLNFINHDEVKLGVLNLHTEAFFTLAEALSKLPKSNFWPKVRALFTPSHYSWIYNF